MSVALIGSQLCSKAAIGSVDTSEAAIGLLKSCDQFSDFLLCNGVFSSGDDDKDENE